MTDLDPPWLDAAPDDAPMVYSEFVAPWRYPEHHGRAAERLEAPRTHVGPYRTVVAPRSPDASGSGH